jgi:hypothetical protein
MDYHARRHAVAAAQVRAALRSPRVLVAAPALALVASYGWTWDLWQPRVDPPNLLGVAGLDRFGFAAFLALTAGAAVAAPRAGAVAHTAVFALAVAGDQTRIQPEFVSLALLLAAAPWPTGLFVIRWHLISLWWWAGAHKVLSLDWPAGNATAIAETLGVRPARAVVAVAVPLAEMGLAALALRPRTWRLLAIVAPIFHLGVVAVLATAWWNGAVWPWNLSLAVLAPVVFPRSGPGYGDDTGPRALLPGRGAVVAAAAFLLYPAGFYVSITDAYLAHNLYSGNSARAAVCETRDGAESCTRTPSTMSADLAVPPPPEPRLLRARFERTCAPGQRLRIEGIRTRVIVGATTFTACPW